MMVKCVIYFFCPEYLQSTLMMDLLVNNQTSVSWLLTNARVAPDKPGRSCDVKPGCPNAIFPGCFFMDLSVSFRLFPFVFALASHTLCLKKLQKINE